MPRPVANNNKKKSKYQCQRMTYIHITTSSSTNLIVLTDLSNEESDRKSKYKKKRSQSALCAKNLTHSILQSKSYCPTQIKRGRRAKSFPIWSLPTYHRDCWRLSAINTFFNYRMRSIFRSSSINESREKKIYHWRCVKKEEKKRRDGFELLSRSELLRSLFI